MATRRYKISPGQTEFQVIEEVGAATNSNVVELTVDMAALVADANSSPNPRTITREEILLALEQIGNHIISNIYPPV